jgi:hypothetical protein
MKSRLSKNKQKQLRSDGLGHQHTPRTPTQRRKKQLWPDGLDIDTSHNSTKTYASPPPNHYELVVTLHRYHPKGKAIKTKSPLSLLAPSLPSRQCPTLSSQLLAGLAVVIRCKPCHPSAISSACTVSEDVVPHRNSHRKARLQAACCCILPNRRQRSCLRCTPTPHAEIHVCTPQLLVNLAISLRYKCPHTPSAGQKPPRK